MIRQRAIYLLALPALLACCTQDEPGGGIPDAGESLHVSSAALDPGGHTETGTATRVPGDDAPVSLTQGSLGVFRAKTTGYAASQDNRRYNYVHPGKWTSPDGIILNNCLTEVCAYYPYNSAAGYSDRTALPLASGKYTGTHDPADICYDTDRQVSAGKRNTSFILRHALAMLEFRLSKEAGYAGECRLTGVSLASPVLVASSTVNITNGTYSAAPVRGTVAYNPGADAAGILIGNEAVTTAALLVPFTPDASGVNVSFTVNGAPVEAVIPVGNLSDVQAGHRYTVKVTLTSSRMQVTGVDILPWTDTTVGGDGHIWLPQERTGIRVAEKDINLGGAACTTQDKTDLAKLTWADGNLMSTDNTKPYEVGGTNDYGLYYTWMSLYTGDTTMQGGDPCLKLDPKKYGFGWRTPSRIELEKLARCSDKQLVDNYGTRGMWFMNNTIGLFLPAAGCRDVSIGSGTTPTVDPGVYGNYWSSDEYERGMAYSLTFYSGYTGLYNVYYDMPYGFPVRCVKGK